MLADLENVGVSFGISLLSDIESKILRYFIRTSGNGGHVRFTTHPDVGMSTLVLTYW